jgi:S-adenosylmethionine-dependent methyltransferase
VAGERRGGGLEVPPGTGAPTPIGTAQRWNRYDDARTAVIREVLRAVVTGMVADTGRSRLDIVDAGGGTGGSAVPLAGQGHTVTVIDPSPDSLAAAQRRAAEMNVQLRAVQGDVGDLAAVIGEQGADLVLCHSVLEYVDSPAAAMTTVASVLRPGGAVSVLATSAVAAVIHRALAGRFDEARRLLAAIGGPAGGGQAGGGQAGGPGGRPGSGADGGAGPRRFTLAEVTGLIEGAGLRPGAAHGIRVFTDLVPGSFADVDPGAADALLALEQAASTHPAFHDFAAQFHVLGYR